MQIFLQQQTSILFIFYKQEVGMLIHRRNHIKLI